MLSSYPIPSVATAEKFSSLRRFIGNTPMVEIICSYEGVQRSVLAKCEYFNLAGSIKDSMALRILERAWWSGEIGEGDTIVEVSSGNTGISFSSIGKRLGHPVKIIMPDWMSRERKDIIRSLAADIIEVSHDKGGFLYSLRLAEEMAAAGNHIFQTELPEVEQFVSVYSGKKLRTVGNKFSDLQASVFGTNAQPRYALLDPYGRLLAPPQGAGYNAENFIAFLDAGLENF